MQRQSNLFFSLPIVVFGVPAFPLLYKPSYASVSHCDLDASGFSGFMISERAQQIRPFIAMDVFEKAQELEARGEKVIHLEVGEPDFATPEVVKEAAIRALAEGKTRYTSSLGILPLREAIAEHYEQEYGIRTSPDQIVVCSGTSPALLLTFSVLLNPGDRVILSNPGYPCYSNHIEFLGGVPEYIDVHEENGFALSPEAVYRGIDEGGKVILINSPANPTGTVLSSGILQSLSEMGIPLISDEIYHGLVYEGETHTALEFRPDVFVLNGFSKLYAMTGWRLGYVISPPSYVRALQKLQQNFFISAGDFIQWAGLQALRAGEQFAREARETLNRRRLVMLDALRGMGFEVFKNPTGAFYIFANARKFSSCSYDLAFDILQEAHVAVTPGVDFGSNGEGFLRFSYANSLENIEEAMERLRIYLSRRP